MSAQVLKFSDFSCKQPSSSRLVKTSPAPHTLPLGPAHQTQLLQVGYTDHSGVAHTLAISTTAIVSLLGVDPMTMNLLSTHLEGILALMGGHRLESITQVSSQHIEMLERA